MLRTKSWFGVSAAVAALLVGMLSVGCGDKSTSPSATLNGKWGMSTDDGFVVCDLKADKSFEMQVDGKLFSKGTYTAVSPNFTLTITHVNSAAVSLKYPVITLPSNWYTKSEIKTELDKINPEIYGQLEEKGIDDMFSPQDGTYSLNGNKLIVWHHGNSMGDTFIRQ